MRRILILTFLFTCGITTAAAQNVKFVSGGVSDDSAERMAALGKEFNLKLLFAAKDGHYLADVAVSISDAGNRKMLETVSEGTLPVRAITARKICDYRDLCRSGASTQHYHRTEGTARAHLPVGTSRRSRLYPRTT
jgi:hypothetical protein